MSTHEVLEATASDVQQPLGAEQGANQSRTLRDCELMRLVGLKHAAFYRRKERGEFRFLELKPQLPDSNTLYSRALVNRWLSGELPTPERFFGRATPRVPGARPVGRPRKGQQLVSRKLRIAHGSESLTEARDVR